ETAAAATARTARARARRMRVLRRDHTERVAIGQDVSGRRSARRGASPTMSENVQSWRGASYKDWHEARSAGRLPRAAVAGSALRRQVLHGRSEHADLLPVDLSRADGEGEERPVLSVGRGRRGGRLSAVPALPSRVLAGNARVARHVEHGFESPPP